MIFAHTNLASFELCPKQFQHKYVLKDLPKEAPSPALLEGRNAHQAFEDRLKNLTPLPKAFASYEPYCLVLEPYKPQPEMSLAMTIDGQPTGFWDKGAWLRGKIDLPLVQEPNAVLLDWKTGKKREDPDELEIFGLLFRANFPLVKQVSGYYIWLKEGKVGQMHDLSSFAEKFEQVRKRTERVEAAIKADFFPPIESWACSFCPVRTCHLNRKRD